MGIYTQVCDEKVIMVLLNNTEMYFVQNEAWNGHAENQAFQGILT